MGVTDLPKTLKDAGNRQSHISEMAGQTLGVDVEVWLHKAAGTQEAAVLCSQEPPVPIRTGVAVVGALHRRPFEHNITPVYVFGGSRHAGKAGEDRRRAAPKDTAAGSADAEYAHSVVGGAPAFIQCAADALNGALRRIETHTLRQLNAEDSTGVSMVEKADASAILRVFVKLREVCVLQFLLKPGARCPTSKMFVILDKYRNRFASYLAAYTFMDEDGALPHDLVNAPLEPAFLKSFLAGQNWDTVDLLDALDGPIHRWRHQSGRGVTWPHNVFKDENALLTLRRRGDQFFAALGYARNDPHGFYGCISVLLKYLNTFKSEHEDPSGALYDYYKTFMRTAQLNFQSALSADASSAFPLFDTAGADWRKGMIAMSKSATDDAMDRRRRGHVAGASPDTARGVRFGHTSLATAGGVERMAPYSGGAASGYGGQDASRKRERPASPFGGTASDNGAPPSGNFRMTASNDRIGENQAWVVKYNASVMDIKFPVRGDASNTVTYRWDVPACCRYMKAHEGGVEKCLPCAVISKEYLRYTVCQCKGQNGHRTVDDKLHNFISEPWNELGTQKYCKRL